MIHDLVDGFVVEGDCREVLHALPGASVDFVFADPPYPEIDRPYGRWTEAEWDALMNVVVEQCRRVLVPSGSMAILLRPNQERVGRTRSWLWRFLARWSERWNLVQPAFWWNHTALPTVHCRREHGLMRSSLSMVVWLGAPDCFRCQDAVLWEPSRQTKAADLEDRALRISPSGSHVRHGRACAMAIERGGSTPFDVLPLANANSASSSGAHGHGAGTPAKLVEWWIRYCCPAPDGIVLDPFFGAGTTGVVARALGRRFVGIEKHAPYVEAALSRLARSASEHDRP